MGRSGCYSHPAISPDISLRSGRLGPLLGFHSHGTKGVRATRKKAMVDAEHLPMRRTCATLATPALRVEPPLSAASPAAAFPQLQPLAPPRPPPRPCVLSRCRVPLRPTPPRPLGPTAPDAVPPRPCALSRRRAPLRPAPPRPPESTVPDTVPPGPPSPTAPDAVPPGPPSPAAPDAAPPWPPRPPGQERRTERETFLGERTRERQRRGNKKGRKKGNKK
jgi:hypothetical protein